jgi:hypothetical protein
MKWGVLDDRSHVCVVKGCLVVRYYVHVTRRMGRCGVFRQRSGSG